MNSASRVPPNPENMVNFYFELRKFGRIAKITLKPQNIAQKRPIVVVFPLDISDGRLFFGAKRSRGEMLRPAPRFKTGTWRAEVKFGAVAASTNWAA